MQINWHRHARVELEDAAEYYEVRKAGLGQEFIAEVEHVIELIRQSPNGWPRMTDNSRRCRTRRFPYGIVYQLHGDAITILAVMHLARAPGYWTNREE
jgi:plasmid stabilization system protein ParE